MEAVLTLSTPPPTRKKELGAFYTPAAMAEKLVQFAVREPSDRILDPSFGGLVFLEAAHDRLKDLGATAQATAEQLYGCDLDEDAHTAALAHDRFGVRDEALLHGDFFSFSPGVEIDPVEAVVGNPPYIRYQLAGRDGGANRSLALAAEAGVPLTRLASSWAPFVLHATSFVAPGGRMALVLPAELMHAQYAGEVLSFVRNHFKQVSLAVFEHRVFPGALEEVVLLFAEGRGEGSAPTLHFRDYSRLEDLDIEDLALRTLLVSGERPEPEVRGKLLGRLLSADVRRLYDRLWDTPEVQKLGSHGSVDIGAVTGANDFFLLAAREERGLAEELLRPAVSKAIQIPGARLTPDDHAALSASGRRCHMFVADANTPDELLATAKSYLRRGKRRKVPSRYKCRVRSPWWSLPLPKHGVPDLLMTYCAAEHPRVSINEVGALHTNTLHGIKVMGGMSAEVLAAGFYNSLTMLSAELVGRSYGGGVLKLEPTEAEAVLVPPLPDELADVLPAIDTAIRGGDLAAALDIVDPIVLVHGLGLSQDDVIALRAGGEKLRARRRARGKPPVA